MLAGSVYLLYRYKKQKELYRYAIEGSTKAIYNWNIKKNTFYFSPRLKEMLGLNDKEHINSVSEWMKLVHPMDREEMEEGIEKNLSGETDKFFIECRVLHKDSSWKWFRIQAKTFYSSTGTALRMDGIFSDITREKELSIELIKSQNLLKSIIDNIPVRIFWKDLDGVYLGYNKLFSNDISPTDNYSHIGKTDQNMPWKDEAQNYIDDDRLVMQEGEAKLNFEQMKTTPDGHIMWVSTSKMPLVNEDGMVCGVLGVYHDITEHKLHLKENEETTHRLEMTQYLTHMGSWEWDIISGELIWSDEVYRIFGEEPQSFPATYEAFLSYVPLEYQAGLKAAIQKALETNSTYEYDHEVRRKDGSIRLVRETGYVRFDADGTPTTMLGTVMDINSILLAENTMRENEELTRRLQKFDENIIASNTDLNGVITYASQAFSRISGYSVDELIGKPQSIVRHEDTPKKLFEELWKTIRSGSEWHGELKNKAKDGSAYWVETTVSPTFDRQQNEIIGYSSIRRDITYEKQVQELHRTIEKKSYELQALNEDLEKRITDAVLESKQKDHLMAQQSKLASMGEMIGNIAHQWRQPLNALALLLQKQQIFHERGLLTAEKIDENVKKGTMLINKMSSTIDDFRDFFKPNKQKIEFDIKGAVEDTLELINAALYNKNIELQLNIDAGHTIYGYKNEFSQVILNLINNAKDVLIEKAVKDAKITIDAIVKDDMIRLCISDNGGGIPQDIIEHIFEPYFTTKDEGKGTGVGLYMSKMIIEDNMHGQLSVHNDADGAVFIISLKLSTPSAEEKKEAS